MKCAECGKELTGKWQIKFCSKYCMWACHARERKITSEEKRKRVCQICGKEFVMCWPSGKANKGEVKEGLFCSRKCRGQSRRNQPRKNGDSCKVYFPICKVCGMQFTSNWPRIICDNENCESQYSIDRSVIYNKKKMSVKTSKSRLCKECNRPFISEYGEKRRTFCSILCGSKYAQRNAKAIRRARKRGNKCEPFNPYFVFNRDHWTCQLCYAKTPRKLRGTHNDHAPELDHIVSLAEGGEHSARNTQCLCRKCNQDKGATTKGQLRIFG